MNDIHQKLAFAVDVNLIGDDINIVAINADMLSNACKYEGQSISNASYFVSPLLFKKSQIQLHRLKITNLTINLSLFNIISVHFHRFGPPFNKCMYSSAG